MTQTTIATSHTANGKRRKAATYYNKYMLNALHVQNCIYSMYFLFQDLLCPWAIDLLFLCMINVTQIPF